MVKEKTISETLLLEKGYLKFKETYKDNVMEKFYQKKVCDTTGKKYVIDCKYLSFLNDKIERKSFWEFEMQLYNPYGAVNISLVQWFNQDGIYSNNSIEDAEEYLEKMWITNGSIYNETYNEEMK